MQYKDTVSIILERIRSFPSVCLYGAGDYAEMIYSIFERLDISVDKVVVSSNGKGLFHGFPISSVSEVLLGSEDIVVGAYNGATISEIRDKIGPEAEIVVFSDKQLNCAYNELILADRLAQLDSAYDSPRAKIEFRDLKRILIIRLDALGDLVMTSAFIRELHSNCPQANITLIVRPGNVDLFEDCPYINEVIPYDCPQMMGTLSSQVRRSGEIQERIDSFLKSRRDISRYDALFLPRELMQGRSCYEEFLLANKISSDYKIGRIRAFEPEQMAIQQVLGRFFSVIMQTQIMHETEYMLDIIIESGGKVTDTSLEIWCHKGSSAVDKEGTAKCISLGINAATPSRAWPIEKYKQLILKYLELYGTEYRFVLLGDCKASEKTTELAELDNVIDLTGKTALKDVAAVMSDSALYVGSNTGLMHMAVASGLPCVVLYATLPDVEKTDGNSSYRMGAWNVRHIDLAPEKALDGCSGVCKKTFPHCIDTISVEQVSNAIMAMMSE